MSGTQSRPITVSGDRSPLLKRIAPSARCVEVGVWKGDFSAEILDTANPAELHLVDPWSFEPRYPGRLYGGRLAKNQSEMDRIYFGVVNRFRFFNNVLVHRMKSVAAAEVFEPKSLDWVYIDGDHSYSAVLADLQAWYPKVVTGGLLTGDDLAWRGEDGTHPVKAAVLEFCRRNQISTVNEVNNQFVIDVVK